MHQEAKGLPYTGLQRAIRVLEVIVFETGKGGMGDGKRDAGKVGFIVPE